MINKNVVVMDTGGCLIKLGFAGEENPRKIFPNCKAKFKNDTQAMIGDMLCDRSDIFSLRLNRPFEKGYMINMNLQKEIWNRTFEDVLKIDTKDYSLIVVEPMFNFESIRKEMRNCLIEQFKFKHVIFKKSAELAIIADNVENFGKRSSQAKTAVVVDIGFSFTHIIPIFDGNIIIESVKRIDFGGKAMTNLFKELLSFRSLHVMDQTYLVEKLKEEVFFVSENFKEDLRKSKEKSWDSPFKCEYVISNNDGAINGYIRYKKPKEKELKEISNEQILTINNERFTIPEILFNPTDIGLNQAGLPEAINESILSCNPFLHDLLYENIILIGGLAKCKGLKERLDAEIRSRANDKFKTCVFTPRNPDIYAWKGGSYLGQLLDEFK